jgi:hypothetical protein
MVKHSVAKQRIKEIYLHTFRNVSRRQNMQTVARAATDTKPDVAKVSVDEQWGCVLSWKCFDSNASSDIPQRSFWCLQAAVCLTQVADSIGLPTEEGLFGFKPFPEVGSQHSSHLSRNRMPLNGSI